MAQAQRTSMRVIVKDFAERTTCHGIGQIFGSDILLWRIFWVLAFLAGFGMLVYQCIALLDTFFRKPVATSLDITFSEMVSFPAVTVCNLNMIKRSKVPHFPEIRLLLDTYKNASESAKPLNASGFVNSDMSSALKGRMRKTGGHKHAGTLSDVSIDTQAFLEDRVISLMARETKRDLEKAGHSFDELVFRCVFNGFDCNSGDFLHFWRAFWHWRYGNCYTFNFGVNALNGTEIPHLTSSKSGPLHGLTLDLFINQDEYTGALSQEAGVKVLLSDQGEMPFPTVDGFNVAPGVVAYIGIRKLVIERVDPFRNGSCYGLKELEEFSIYKSHKGFKYSVQGCMNSCLAAKQYKRCNCTDGKFRWKGTVPCLETNDLKCLNDIEDLYENGSLGCINLCPQPCKTSSYRRSLSQAKWSEAYEGYFQRTVKKSPNGVHNHMHNDVSTLRNNFLRLKLYYEDLNQEKITYSEYYLIQNFLGDFGGQLGLWIGVSVITVAEFGKLLLDLCLVMFKKVNSVAQGK